MAKQEVAVMGSFIPGVGGLLAAGREQRILEAGVKAAKSELEKELAAARKAVKDDSYCWTMKDVAQELGRHPKTIARWIRVLGLPFRKIGRNVVFRPGDVRRWAAQRKEG